jgi:peroxiredoxin
MTKRYWIAGGLLLALVGVAYENLYLAAKPKPKAQTGARATSVRMVSLKDAKIQMIYFWGDCNCHENTAAELIAEHRAYDVHSRIVRLNDPDRAALMRKYRITKTPYTVFLDPKTGKERMRMQWATYDDFQDSIHELLRDSGYAFSDKGTPVPRGVAKVGQPAPEIEVVSEASVGITLDQYRGRKVLLAFLCGCGLCKPLVPKLNAIVREHGQDRVTVLGITAFTTEQRDVFKSENKPDFPICIDLNRKTLIHYASEACPRLWLIDEQGIIRYNNKSITTPTARLVADLHQQLGA